MTDEQISAIWEFDYETFLSDRAYLEKKQDLSDYEDTLQNSDSIIDECNIEENWHEYITDIDKRCQLSELRPEQRRAYYLCRVMNTAVRDASVILHKPRATNLRAADIHTPRPRKQASEKYEHDGGSEATPITIDCIEPDELSSKTCK